MGDSTSTASAATPPTSEHVPARSSTPASRLEAVTARPWALELAAVAFTAFASLFIAALTLHIWRAPDLRTPFTLDGDALSLMTNFKTIHDHGWVFHNANLGAPAGQDFQDFSSTGADNLHWVIIWLMARVVATPGGLYNGFLLLAFPMTAVSAYACLRWLGITRLVAIVPGVLFSIIPYHFQRELIGHLFLAEAAAMPIAIYLAIAVARGLPLFRLRDTGPRWLRWASPLTLRTIALCAVAASTGIYYAVFALFFVGVGLLMGLAGERDEAQKRVAIRGALVLVAIGAVLAFNQAPTVIYHHNHGQNTAVGTRSPSESEVYGLNIAGLALPSPTHRVSALAELGQKYWNHTSMPSEGSTWGGTFSTVGFVLLAAVLLAALQGAATGLRTDPRLRAAAGLTVAGLLLGATGAGSALVAFVLSPSLRAWSRVTPALIFCSLLAVAVALDALRARHRTPRGSAVFAAGLAALLVVGALDQTQPGFAPRYEAARATWSNDAHFVAAIEGQLGGHGEVLQLPYLPFPESPPIVHMTDYSPFKGYLHSTSGIRWSYGAMKGRPADWQDDLAQRPIEQQIDLAAVAGFDGVWIDTAGYSNPDQEAVAPIAAIAGTAPIRSADGRLAYFDLRPLQQRLQAKLGPAGTRQATASTLDPVHVDYGTGFYPPEGSAATAWRWAQARSEIDVDNPSSAARPLVFHARLSSVRTAAVSVLLDGRTVLRTRSKPKSGTPVRVSMTLPPGRHAITLVSSAPKPTATDPRDLHLQVIDPQLDSPAAVAALEAGGA